MVFSSFVFLAGFLPAFLALYYLCPPRWRNWCALAASALFYAWGAPRFVLILLGSCAADYLLGREIERAPADAGRRRARLLALAVGVNLVFFLHFKYSNFLVHEANRLLAALGLGTVPWAEVALPVGISFITFHKISYLVDVSRGSVHAARSFRDYLLYILLFPQLIAGPILRYHWMADQLVRRVLDGGRIEQGIVRFCQGLAKKVLIANPLGRGRRPGVHDAAHRAAGGVRLDRPRLLHLPDLLRLLRLLGHGARHRADAGLRVRRELPPPVRGAQLHGLLAALAHLALRLDARVPLHPARRQPRRAAAAVC